MLYDPFLSLVVAVFHGERLSRFCRRLKSRRLKSRRLKVAEDAYQVWAVEAVVGEEETLVEEASTTCRVASVVEAESVVLLLAVHTLAALVARRLSQ